MAIILSECISVGCRSALGPICVQMSSWACRWLDYWSHFDWNRFGPAACVDTLYMKAVECSGSMCPSTAAVVEAR